jgi:hypothetical protein
VWAFAFDEGLYLMSIPTNRCSGSQIRSIYRVTEFALGIEGYPFQHEWPLYALEATPMLIAIAILAIFHPVNLVQKSSGAVLDD